MKQLLAKVKRPVLNGLALLVIVVIGLTAQLKYQSSGDSNANKIKDLPPLHGKVVKVDIDDELREINIYLFVDNVTTTDAITEDMIALYVWGREKLPPLVCGPLYPPDLCVQRWVKITWVARYGDDLYPTHTFGLDQVGIDRLKEVKPKNVEEFDAFLENITEASGGTGLFYKEYPRPTPPLDGFK